MHPPAHACRSGARCLCGAALACTLAACQTTSPPRIDSEAAIGDAIGLGAPIAFSVEGGLLDEPGDLERLTPADATRLAATTDPGLQMSLARVRIALADADQARLLPNPVLNLIFKFPTSGGKPSIETELTADVLSILQTPRRASAADNRLRGACAEAMTIALDVVVEVQSRYAAVQALDELMPILEERRRLLDRLRQLSQDRLNAGEGTRSDLTTLEAERVELDVEIAEKQQERRDERLRLSRLIGQPSGEADWGLEPWRTPRDVAASESAWIETALVNRPEVRAVMWELAALGDDLALARIAPFDGGSAGVKAERDGGWSVGPSISTPIPVFDFGQAKRAKATAQQIEARHRLTQAKRQVVEDVRRAYQSLAASQANLERVRTELIPLQEQRRSQAEDAYRAGQTDVRALFLAEQDLQASLAKRVELEEASAVSMVRLERAVGGGGVAAKLGASGPATTPAASSTHSTSEQTDNFKRTRPLGGLTEALK